MSFGQAVKSVFRQYASFGGRARRSEYWWFALFNFLVQLPAQVIFFVVYFRELAPVIDSADSEGNVSDTALNNIDWAAVGAGYVPMLLVGLVLFLPGLAVVVRRLHDTGRSGWWYWISLVPFGSIVLLVFMFLDGQPYDNQYGQDPKAASRAGGGYPPQGYAQPAQLSYPAQPGYPAPSGYPAQPGYPTAPPPYAAPTAQPGYPTQPGYPVAPPPYTPPAQRPGTNDPFETPGN